MKDPEKLSSTFFLIFSIFILSQSLALPFGRFSEPESGFFPSVISCVMIILSLALLCGSLFDKEKRGLDFGQGLYSIGITATTMILYAVFLDFLGYLICTLITGVVLLKIVHKQGWVITTSISILYAMISYFGFQVFGVFLPQGMIHFL